MPKGPVSKTVQSGAARRPAGLMDGLESTHRWEELHEQLSSDFTAFKSDAQISRPFPGKARLLSERSPGP